MTRTLIIDNNIDQPWGLCADFRRHLSGECTVRRAPQQDLPATQKAAKEFLKKFTHVILSGSKTSVLDSSPWVLQLMDVVKVAVEMNIPVLGICYGHQIIARTFGGIQTVGKSPAPEFGWVEIEQMQDNPILRSLPTHFYTFESHEEEVLSLPKGFIATARSKRCSIQAFFAEEKPVFGLQFHPEKNEQEGQKSINQKKKTQSRDCIFGDGQAESLTKGAHTEHANTIFKNFIELGNKN